MLEGSLGAGDNMDLYWDSWDMQKVAVVGNSVRSHRSRGSRSSVPSAEEEYLNPGGGGHSCSTTPCTPVTTLPPSSLNSPSLSSPIGSHGNLIYSPTNSSVFSPSSSPMDPTLTPPSTPPPQGTPGSKNSKGEAISYLIA